MRHPTAWLFPVATLLAPLLILGHLAPAAEPKPPKPNLVVILADDLGYGDLGCYGHPSIRTPQLDRMAAQGMRFTDFYATAEVCTPSRAALLTGRYPVRSGMCHDRFRVLRRNSAGGLPAGEITLAQKLKEAGYATGMVGKWHLGVFALNPAYHPRQHGFDFYLGLPHSNDMDPDPSAPKGAPARLDQQAAWWRAPLFRNEELLERPADQTKLTSRYTEEAVNFIRQNKQRPFFLYFAHTFPHVPLFASPGFRSQSPRGLYGDVVEELDWSVGRILDVLRAEGLERNTLVLFTSDNGPWLTQGLAGGSAGLLRDGKGSTYEGGMRVPGLAWWPGRIQAGVVSRDLACQLDVFPTCLALAGVEAPRDRFLDGFDLAPVLFGHGPSPREVFFYYRGTQLYAARQGPFKAHYITRSAYGNDAPVKHDPPLLFHLGHDPSEQFNLATNQPAVLAGLAREVTKHQATLRPVKSQLEEVVPEDKTPNPPRFKVMAFYTGKNDQAHVSFVREANRWFPKMAAAHGFAYDATNDWRNLNLEFLAPYQVVLFLDTRPEAPAQRAAFQKYMENGGGWIGFHFAAFALTPSQVPQNWDWYHKEFLGSDSYAGNTWRPTSAMLKVEDLQHPATRGLPVLWRAAPNEWYQWTGNLRTNRQIRVLASIAPASFPLGTGPKPHEIWHSGDYPVVWTNLKYRMLYVNMGHNDLDYENKTNQELSFTFENETQNKLILNALEWLGTGKKAEPSSDK